MTNAPPDRRHNREEDSPEALRRSIDVLAEAIAALDRRLDESALRLDRDIDVARATTRRLANEVGLMGEALVRRIEAEKLCPIPAKRQQKHPWLWAFAITITLMLAIAGLVVFPK
jgi:hypothetical protein